MMIEMAQELGEILNAVEQAWIQDHGYTLLYRMVDGEALCGRCVQENKALILACTAEAFSEASSGSDIRQWAILGVESAEEYDEPQLCAHCACGIVAL